MKRFLCRSEMMAGLIVLLLVALCPLASATVVSVAYTGVDTQNYVSVYDSVYAGAYNLSMDGQAILGMCDDYDAHVPGVPWQASYYSFSDAVDNGRWSNETDAKNNYNIIGYLFSQSFDNNGDYITNKNKLAAINVAIWNVFNNSVDFVGEIGEDASALLANAKTKDYSGDYYEWQDWMYFLTPEFDDYGKPVSQEFLVRGTAPVPEPATMLLLGTGLIGLAGVGRKKFLK